MRALLVALALAFPASAEAETLYRNSVQLRPGEFARFVVSLPPPPFYTVAVTDGRAQETARREVSTLAPRARFHPGQVRGKAILRKRLVIRVENYGARGRRVRVRVAR